MKKNILLGIIFIISAGLIIADAILDAIGLAPSIPIYKIALCVPFFIWTTKAFFKRNIAGIFFPLSFIFLVLEKEIGVHLLGIGENIVSNWLVLLSALLLTIGFELIFGEVKIKWSNGHIVSSSTNKNHLGQGVKYIDSATFKYEVIKNTLGQFDIYFQNLDAYEGGGTIEVINKLGETNIYLPNNWNVESQISSSKGEYNILGEGDPNGKTIKIIGKNKLGEVNIHINKV